MFKYWQFWRLKITNNSFSRVLKSWCLDSWCGTHDETHGIHQQKCPRPCLPSPASPCRPDACSWPWWRLVSNRSAASTWERRGAFCVTSTFLQPSVCPVSGKFEKVGTWKTLGVNTSLPSFSDVNFRPRLGYQLILKKCVPAGLL